MTQQEDKELNKFLKVLCAANMTSVIFRQASKKILPLKPYTFKTQGNNFVYRLVHDGF
jgi:hypothetical protein